MSDDIFTDEELAELEAASQKYFATESLNKETMLLFRLLIVMWNIGKANGVWSDSDIDDNLRTKIANWKNRLDEFIAIENS